MSCYDDPLRWKILEKVIGPLAAAVLTGGFIYGSMKTSLDDLVKAELPIRMTRVETQFVDIDKKLDRVLDKLDR